MRTQPLPAPLVALTAPGPVTEPATVVRSAGVSVTLLPAMPSGVVASAMKMLRGSSRNSPAMPAGARRSTMPSSTKSDWPETSMKPPLPPDAPPRAESVPRISVRSVLLTTISPPWPLPEASALIVAPRATVVRAAMVWLCPRPVVPTSTWPPPVPPEASMRAAAATVTCPVAWSATRPPRAAASPVAVSVPSR